MTMTTLAHITQRILHRIAHETYYVYAGLLALDLVLLSVLYVVTGGYPPVLHDVAYLLVAALAGAAGQRIVNGAPPAQPPHVTNYYKG